MESTKDQKDLKVNSEQEILKTVLYMRMTLFLQIWQIQLLHVYRTSVHGHYFSENGIQCSIFGVLILSDRSLERSFRCVVDQGCNCMNKKGN